MLLMPLVPLPLLLVSDGVCNSKLPAGVMASTPREYSKALDCNEKIKFLTTSHTATDSF